MKKIAGNYLPSMNKLEKMKKQELIKLCSEFDIDCFGSKADLVQKIKELERKNENHELMDSDRVEKGVEKKSDVDDSYDLQFVDASGTKITFIDDPSKDTLAKYSGVKIFLPVDSPVEFLMRWEKGVRHQRQPGSRRFCGAIMMSITEELGKQMEDGGMWTGGKGVLVCRVLRGSPAHGGGLAPGDCIIEVNGVPVFSLRDIYKELEGKGMMDCTVIREGKLKTGVCFEPLEN